MSKALTCPRSDAPTSRFPGDEDYCVACDKWVVVKENGNLRKHTISRKNNQTWIHERKLKTLKHRGGVA